MIDKAIYTRILIRESSPVEVSTDKILSVRSSENWKKKFGRPIRMSEFFENVKLIAWAKKVHAKLNEDFMNVAQ